jgi:hypothetical protein
MYFGVKQILTPTIEIYYFDPAHSFFSIQAFADVVGDPSTLLTSNAHVRSLERCVCSLGRLTVSSNTLYSSAAYAVS